MWEASEGVVTVQYDSSTSFLPAQTEIEGRLGRVFIYIARGRLWSLQFPYLVRSNVPSAQVFDSAQINGPLTFTARSNLLFRSDVRPAQFCVSAQIYGPLKVTWRSKLRSAQIYGPLKSPGTEWISIVSN